MTPVSWVICWWVLSLFCRKDPVLLRKTPRGHNHLAATPLPQMFWYCTRTQHYSWQRKAEDSLRLGLGLAGASTDCEILQRQQISPCQFSCTALPTRESSAQCCTAPRNCTDFCNTHNRLLISTSSQYYINISPGIEEINALSRLHPSTAALPFAYTAVATSVPLYLPSAFHFHVTNCRKWGTTWPLSFSFLLHYLSYRRGWISESST